MDKLPLPPDGWGHYYWTVGCLVIGGIIVLGGIVDACLVSSGAESMSDWLRKHPAAYWLPFGLVTVFFVLLGLHLYFPWGR